MATNWRKSQYKLGSPGYKGNWKEAYREQCQQRLRDNRSKQFERLRQCETTEDIAASAVKHAMEMTNESFSQSSSSPYMDQLTEELIAEERCILQQYMEDMRFAEQAVSATIDSSETVVCPICQQSPLLQNHHIIFCNCGLRIDTQDDVITLVMLQQQLTECCSQHAVICSAPNNFTVTEQFGITNVILSCEVCGFVYIVI